MSLTNDGDGGKDDSALYQAIHSFKEFFKKQDEVLSLYSLAKENANVLKQTCDELQEQRRIVSAQKADLDNRSAQLDEWHKECLSKADKIKRREWVLKEEERIISRSKKEIAWHYIILQKAHKEIAERRAKTRAAEPQTSPSEHPSQRRQPAVDLVLGPPRKKSNGAQPDSSQIPGNPTGHHQQQQQQQHLYGPPQKTSWPASPAGAPAVPSSSRVERGYRGNREPERPAGSRRPVPEPHSGVGIPGGYRGGGINPGDSSRYHPYARERPGKAHPAPPPAARDARRTYFPPLLWQDKTYSPRNENHDEATGTATTDNTLPGSGSGRSSPAPGPRPVSDPWDEGDQGSIVGSGTVNRASLSEPPRSRRPRSAAGDFPSWERVGNPGRDQGPEDPRAAPPSVPRVPRAAERASSFQPFPSPSVAEAGDRPGEGERADVSGRAGAAEFRWPEGERVEPERGRWSGGGRADKADHARDHPKRSKGPRDGPPAQSGIFAGLAVASCSPHLTGKGGGSLNRVWRRPPPPQLLAAQEYQYQAADASYSPNRYSGGGATWTQAAAASAAGGGRCSSHTFFSPSADRACAPLGMTNDGGGPDTSTNPLHAPHSGYGFGTQPINNSNNGNVSAGNAAARADPAARVLKPRQQAMPWKLRKAGSRDHPKFRSDRDPEEEEDDLLEEDEVEEVVRSLQRERELAEQQAGDSVQLY